MEDRRQRMQLIVEVTEDYYARLKEKMVNRRATISDATILDGIPYEERPKGEWIEEKLSCGNILHCSECGARPRRSEYGYDLRDNFCHNCGADLRVKDELNNEINKCGAKMGKMV